MDVSRAANPPMMLTPIGAVDQFNEAGQQFVFTGGTEDLLAYHNYQGPVLGGPMSLAAATPYSRYADAPSGLFVTLLQNSQGTYDSVNKTLVIPIDYLTPIETTFSDSIFLNMYGTIVAHPFVPEPSSLALAALGFVALAAWRLRRRRTI